MTKSMKHFAINRAILCALLVSSLLFSNSSIAASLTVNNTAYSGQFSFINELNQSLNFKVKDLGFDGIKTIAAFQKNRNIIVQVIHNPFLGYQKLIENLAASGSRTNGVNFQNSLSLHILKNFCGSGAFYEIQAAGLGKEVYIQYDSTRGKRVALHTITRKMCS